MRNLFRNRRVLPILVVALLAFAGTATAQQNPFDRYVAGEFDAISESAKNGLRLFIGKAACVECSQLHIGLRGRRRIVKAEFTP